MVLYLTSDQQRVGVLGEGACAVYKASSTHNNSMLNCHEIFSPRDFRALVMFA